MISPHKKKSVWWQYIIPQHFLSQCLGLLAACRIPWLKNTAIRIFIHYFKVDLSEASIENYKEFRSFNAFFTRTLKTEARPLSQVEGCIVSPVDGCISALGQIQKDRIFQAKGKSYSLESLLGGNTGLCETFFHGNFLTAYLAPKDYHRLHMPLAGRLLSMHYIPGRLFSVNKTSVEQINAVFAQNERIVCTFSSDTGIFTLIAIGAMVVGSIATTWHGVVNSPRRRQIATWNYEDRAIHFQQGQEWGYFQLGSTIILLLEKHTHNEKNESTWLPDLRENSVLKMGQLIGHHYRV